MKILFAPVGLVLPLMLVCSMSDANALTLGRARGAALLGQSLDLSVPAQFGPDEESASNCFEAEVYYGDSRQEAGRVSVTAQPAAGSQSVSLRIQSEAKVDEPVVTVYLKAICGQKTSRKYVLLADFPSEPASSLATTKPFLAAQMPSADANIVSSAPVATAGDGGKPGIQSPAASKQSTRASIGSKSKSSVSPSNPVAGATEGRSPATDNTKATKRSRLKLTPMDGLTERDPVLKSTTELVTAPVEDLQKRVEALAMWRALNASAQDVLRDEARMQSLEGGVKSLTAVTAKNRQSLEEISTRLAEAEAQRYANPVVYGLIAALLACFGGLAFLWTRRSGSSDGTPWWGGDSAQPSLYEPIDAKPGKAGVFDDYDLPAPLPVSKTRQVTPAPASVDSVDIDLELGDAPPSTTDVQGPNSRLSSVFSRDSEYSALSRRDFGPSVTGVLRAVNTKEMLDIRQQAEFFMALGRHDEAVAVLQSGVTEGVDANPLVYLDLLKLFHTLSRKSDFDRCREQFNKLFTGLVPAYTSFHLGGNRLEAYPQVCAQIADLWPTSQAIEYIEFCLVRTPADAPDQGFDLEAFRELLLLDAIAKQLETPNVTTIAPFSASSEAHAPTDMAPGTGPDRFGTLSTVPGNVEPQMPAPMLPQETSDNVDLDLSDLNGNLIDFDVSNYEKSVSDDPVADSIPNFNVGSNDGPAGRPG